MARTEEEVAVAVAVWWPRRVRTTYHCGVKEDLPVWVYVLVCSMHGFTAYGGVHVTNRMLVRLTGEVVN
jgi:hypothetical protein